MRKIKFRAWDDKLKIMNYDCTLLPPFRCNVEHKEIWTMMQFTGLKDRNNKDIYEGDIIKTPDNYDEFGIQAGELNEVIFQYGGFRLKPKYDNKAKGFWLEDDKTFEIKGNIYENKDLLK